MRVRVKICGITNIEDAIAAVDAGADALGFMFFEDSKRNVSFAEAAEIISELPPFVAKVGVFVNAPEDFVEGALDCTGIDTVQLHGDESPDYCARVSASRAIKAFRIRDQDSLQGCLAYRDQAWLLDSYVTGAHGGTGVAFNWEVAVEATKLSRMVMLAGGLKPETVAEAVRKVRPYAVDVSSGVESAPGKKDHEKVRRFIRAVQEATL